MDKGRLISKETVVLHQWGVETECLVLSTELITKGKLATVNRKIELALTFRVLAL